MRILLVEDEPGIAQFIYQGLKESGYAVDLAQDGQEAAFSSRSKTHPHLH